MTFAVSGTNTIFEFHLQNGFAVDKIPAYILLGIFCGLVSLYFTRTMNSLEDIFRKYSNPYVKLLIGGATLSILIYLFPSLYGEGYDLINLLLNGNSAKDWDTAMDSSLFYGHGNLLLLYLALVLIFKSSPPRPPTAAEVVAGIFAPSLFLGCISGFIFARLWNFYRCLGIYLPERNFAMIGMAGTDERRHARPADRHIPYRGTHRRLSAIHALMIVSVCAYLTIISFEPHSIYSMRLAKRASCSHTIKTVPYSR